MEQSSNGAAGLLAALSDDLTAVSEAVRTSVVEVRTHNHGGGAGTIWRADGVIITNHHVAPRDQADVALRDGREFTATVIARDPDNDLAVLRVPANDLAAAPRGDARLLRAGDLVMAVGHPLGVRGAISVGVVSAALTADADRRERELIRADILLNPGNSGGPLADARGRVIGINAMVAGGLGIAIPGYVADRLLAVDAERPRLGVIVRDVELSPAAASTAGLTAEGGLLVTAIARESPAERAGLIPGDLILEVNGVRVERGLALVAALAAATGDTVMVRLLRGGAPHEVAVSFAGASTRRAA